VTALNVQRAERKVEQEPLVKVERLTIDFWSNDRWNNVVNGTSFELAHGEALGLVGESGCGKTTTALSLLGFQRPGSRIRSGAIHFAGRDLAHLSRRELQKMRGRRVSLVPQNPTTALSPGLRVGDQLVEAMAVHGVGGSRAERGRMTIARASATRCCWPPESWLILRAPYAPIFTESSAAATRCSVSARGTRRSSRPNATLCATVLVGHSA